MTRSVVVLSGSLRPHELLLLVVGILSTIGFVVGGPAPASLTAVLPGWAVGAFYVLLGVGSTIGLAGCLLRRTEVGPGLEQGGLLLQAAALVLYALAVVAFAGLDGTVAALTFAAWATANCWRATQIQRDLHARAAPR